MCDRPNANTCAGLKEARTRNAEDEEAEIMRVRFKWARRDVVEAMKNADPTMDARRELVGRCAIMLVEHQRRVKARREAEPLVYGSDSANAQDGKDHLNSETGTVEN
ncbi:hypothetical protein MMC18_000133 [Xylographa bjoerkii]|nr:hypothetical protein [Xylographa bjoerkii]